MKKLLIIALSLILAGGLLFTLAACSDDNGLKSALSGDGVETIRDVIDPFESIEIITDTADVTIVKSDDGVCKVVSYDIEKIKYDVIVDNGTLKIEAIDERKWFERILSFRSATLKLYLSESAYSSLLIENDTGNISVAKNFTFTSIDIYTDTGNTDLYSSVSGHIDIEGSTGNVYIKDVSCGSLDIEVSTGNVSINNLECAGDVEIEVSTGNVKLRSVSFVNLSTEGNTGDFTAENLVGDNLSIERSTGKVNVENAVLGGSLITVTDTGNTDLCEIECKGEVSTSLSTGEATMTNVKCNNFTTVATTGHLDMVNVIAGGSIRIERSTGDVTFTRCDASEFTVITDTGDVRGTLLSDKIFFYDTDTGDVDLPESMSGGKCKITTSTGDIVISIEK